ncbi:MAG: hypothetical protein P8M79_06085, partial [Alphaproteobacteria bacterium]|nr:hypothetical protein [Alphaproteobacteria bacterium]
SKARHATVTSIESVEPTAASTTIFSAKSCRIAVFPQFERALHSPRVRIASLRNGTRYGHGMTQI